MVVKDNERIIYNGSISDNDATALSANFFDRDLFAFVHESFNGILTPQPYDNAALKAKTRNVVMGRGTTPRPPSELKRNTDFLFEIHPKIVDAEQVFPAANGGWQRDHIYYNLDNLPNAKGALDRTFVETITAIRLKMSALNLMIDQNDPTYSSSDIDYVHIPGNRDDPKPKFWTDGSFELKIDILFNNLNGPGTVFPTVISAKGDELYYADYDKIVSAGPQNSQYVTYKFKEIVPRWFYCNIPITEWDIENFGFDLGIGNEKVKIGVKFGLTQEETHSSTFTLQRTMASDELGSALANFWDPVLVADNPVSLQDANGYDFLVDLTNATRRANAVDYANLPPYDKADLLNTGTPRNPIPPFWSAEQTQIKAESENRRNLSDFYKVPGANFELIMMPTYKF